MGFTFIYNTGTDATGETMTKDDLTSQINGSIQQFTTSNSFETGSLRVYYNGIYLRSGSDYTEVSSNSFRLLLNTPQTGEDLVVEYVEL